MVSYTKEKKIAIWTEFVKNPRKHKKYQVKVHKQGFYPYVDSSFDTKAQAEKEAKAMIKKVKKLL